MVRPPPGIRRQTTYTTEEVLLMSTQTETGQVTGTRDFRKAQAESRRGAEEGKKLLRQRLGA
jgi:hypothetical protein